MKTIITAMAASLGLAACAQPETPTPAGETSVAALPGALTYECGSDRLEIAFDGGQAEVKTRFAGGAIDTLPIDPDAQNGITYKTGDKTLLLDGADATYTAGGASKECRFVIKDIPAPKVDGMAHALTEADAGKAIDVKVGDKVSIALVGVPTAGYVWGASKPPAWVKASDGPSGATSTAQMLPGFAGGNHWEVVIIEAVAAGEGEIVLAQRRPWESEAEPDADTFKFKLKVS